MVSSLKIFWDIFELVLTHSCVSELCFLLLMYLGSSLSLASGRSKVYSMCWLPQIVADSANLLVWALQVHVHQHSAVRQLNDFFYGACTLLSWRSFPEDLKQIPILVSQILFAASNMLPLKPDLFRTFHHSFLDGTVPTWDHQLWPAKHHDMFTWTLIRAGIIFLLATLDIMSGSNEVCL